MKTFIAISLLSLTALAGVANAENKAECGSAPMDKWMTKEAMQTKAQDMGIEVRQVKVEDGCYEVYGMKDGARVELLFNPQTGAQVGADGDD